MIGDRIIFAAGYSGVVILVMLSIAIIAVALAALFGLPGPDWGLIWGSAIVFRAAGQGWLQAGGCAR